MTTLPTDPSACKSLPRSWNLASDFGGSSEASSSTAPGTKMHAEMLAAKDKLEGAAPKTLPTSMPGAANDHNKTPKPRPAPTPAAQSRFAAQRGALLMCFWVGLMAAVCNAHASTASLYQGLKSRLLNMLSQLFNPR